MRLPKILLTPSCVLFTVVLLGLGKRNQAFLSQTSTSRAFCSEFGCYLSSKQQTFKSHQYMKSDEDYDDEIDPTNLSDWRTFRMNLAESGLPTKPSSTLPTESSLEMDKNEKKKEASTYKPKSVSKENENILKVQNKKLAEEYLSGIWAHSTPTPEVGSLVCRLPLEAEIHRTQDRSIVGKKLKERLKSNMELDDDSSDDSYPNQNFGRSLNSHSLSFSPLAAKTIHWYRRAQRLVSQELEKVTDHAINGRIDSGKLSEDSIEFLNMYLDNQEKWQEVNLVLSRDRETSTSTCLTINRPMSSRLSESMGQLLLYGAAGAAGSLTLPQTELLVRFLIAFESKCYVYIGGSQNQGEPAEIIHGISHLEGSKEIAPGIGIYRGGIEAAIQGVMKGTYKAEEFRFFVGNDIYEDGELERRVILGKFQPVACARSLALKQCVALPKPLWHEVLELCGGELKELSALELMKRSDVMPSQTEDDASFKGKDDDFNWENEDSV